MTFYFCACPACTWKGNKPHRDGQCPVCGNALKIRIQQRRHSSDLASKVILSGLSGDRKVGPSVPDLSLLKEYNLSKRGFEDLLKNGEALRDRLVDSVSKIRFAGSSLTRTVLRFLDDD